MIDARIEKDSMMFLMNTQELAEVMEEEGLIFLVYRHYLQDVNRTVEQGRRANQKVPIRIYHELDGQVHVIKCKVRIWRYFREIEAANPLERFIRQWMVQLGETGQADDIMRLYQS